MDAVHAGYRLIDTAAFYGNEAAVDRAVHRCGVAREELFFTSKLWVWDAGYEAAKKAIDNSLRNLQTDYLDLYLIHRPFGDYYSAWRAMKEAHDAGKIRASGLSNFDPARVVDLTLNNRITPAVDQVECHPYYQQAALKERIAPYGTKIECWYPLGHADAGLLNEPLFTQLGQKYGKSNAQIILRWHIQEGNIIFPKTTNPQHMKDNFNIFDFSLTDDEMAAIHKLDKGRWFFTMTLAEQEAHLKQFVPAD